MTSDHCKVLDFGCGFGRHTRYLSQQSGASVLGVDADATAVAAAQARYGSERVYFEVVPSALPLPFADGRFQLIHCYDVLEHVSEPSALLAEFHRITSPTGHLRIEVPAAVSERFLTFIRPSYLKEIGHLHIFKRTELEDILLKSAFVPTHFRFRRGIQNIELGLQFLRNRSVSWQQGSAGTPKWLLAISLLFQEEMLETPLAKIPLLKYFRYLALPLDYLFPKSMRFDLKKALPPAPLLPKSNPQLRP